MRENLRWRKYQRNFRKGCTCQPGLAYSYVKHCVGAGTNKVFANSAPVTAFGVHLIT